MMFGISALAEVTSGELLIAAAPEAAKYNDWVVALLGIGTVFFGLLCIVIICAATGALFRKFQSPKEALPETNNIPAAVTSEAPDGAVIAAVAAAIADELGSDVSALRITSFRKV